MQPQRRSYSKPFKAQVIQECAQPGASIANVALTHSLNANLDHKWIRVQTQKTMQPLARPFFETCCDDPYRLNLARHRAHGYARRH